MLLIEPACKLVYRIDEHLVVNLVKCRDVLDLLRLDVTVRIDDNRLHGSFFDRTDIRVRKLVHMVALR